MARLTIVFGAALVLTGVIAYFATGRESVTALIPAFFGVPIGIAGLVALRPGWGSYGLYAAMALAALLALGTLRGIFGLLGGEVSTANAINSALFVVSVVFVALGVAEVRRGSRGTR
ncbi:Hypothetical Protein RradSPS_2799 (plasmid) [Rubrobacter radiotolerans]|uniref:Uncharacterized protein n=1 Tax=Rubrobacter radiotolerans TaxID=42256 RepID=A0A023X6M7_RUBRA|nr:hypothetical protein [Rubrobacter radiotolerans]AHY48082.1 Hypothetical Protein RradSPS_2799 [Rubrobacter radiotolerans]MDX5895357.1 hypothetical protein [Rubrobacter radiotolerans]SMC01696.1 conserved hypothetical protein [Rubrobacter radiotolerans DSM 5868]